MCGLIVAFAQMSVTVWAHGDDNHVHSSMGQAVNDLQENLAKQQEIRAKIEQLQSQAKSLQRDLELLQNSEALTALAIQDTQASIVETQELLVSLEEGIQQLQMKLGILNESAERLKRAYHARVKSSYEASFVPTLSVFLASENFQTAVLRYAYLGKVQNEDKQFLTQLQDTVGEYQNRTVELQDLRTEKDALQRQFEQQKVSLEQQQRRLREDQAARRYLIQLTNNDEAAYQRELQKLEAERAAIIQALSQSGTSLGRVTKGQAIARQGNTGCSTGPHIHYSVHRTADLAPMPVCNYIGVAGGTCSSGNYPVSGGSVVSGAFYSPAGGSNRLTQSYWANHLAIDVVSDDGWVYASDDGEAYLVQDPASFAATCRSWGYPYNGVGYGIKVEHDNGITTSYWHIQP